VNYLTPKREGVGVWDIGQLKALWVPSTNKIKKRSLDPFGQWSFQEKK